MKKDIRWIKEFISSQWNKKSNRKKLAKEVFPYIATNFATAYFIPIRTIPEDYDGSCMLPALFQSIWNDILKKQPEKLKIIPKWIGIDLLTIAKQYVVSKQEPQQILCEGILGDGYELENLSYTLKIIPGTEPTIILGIFRYGFEVRLSCTQWDMNYRPADDWKYKPCWFALSSDKYEIINGKKESTEWLQLWNANFTYRGRIFLGKIIENRSCVCEVDYDVYSAGRHEGQIVLQSSGPFIRKLNEHLGWFGITIPLEPFKSK